MLYAYVCESCKFKEDIDLSMTEDHPKEYDCPMCKEKNKMHRDFTQVTLHIPFQFTKEQFDFTKRPRENRKYK